MGAWLRAALGCGHAAFAVTFDAGGFVAQIPNDLEDDLAASTLPAAPEETIEADALGGRAIPAGNRPDGVVFIPRVSVDEVPTDRALLPARQRRWRIA